MKRLVAILAFLLLAPPTFAQDVGWKAGAAKVAITPEKSMWMSGYGARTKPSEGKETELWAKALVLQDAQGKRSVIVSLDLVGIDRDTSLEVCKALEKKYNLPRAGIMLATSHTHCGPVVGTNLKAMLFISKEEEQRIEEYTAQLPAKIVQAVGDAIGRLEPAKVSFSVGQADFAVNRRANAEANVPKLREMNQLKGPSDHDVPVLAVRDARDKLQAVVFGYACHATVLGYQKWCGDYPGFAMIELEKAHPGTVALFVAGCGADQNPLPRRTVELAQSYGKRLAEGVDKVLAQPMTPLAAKWAGAYREIDLVYHEVPNREGLVKDTMSDNKYIANRARLLLAKVNREGPLAKSYPYPVQTWHLGGDVTWVALGGEVVVDYVLRLKKELTPGKTWVTGYANDVMAYIPSLRVLKEGGYEGATAMIYYGLPSIWGVGVEEAIVEEVHRQAKAVR